MKTSEVLRANKPIVDVVAALRCPGLLEVGDPFSIAIHDDRVRIRLMGTSHPIDAAALDRQLDTDDPCLVFDALPFLVALVAAE